MTISTIPMIGILMLESTSSWPIPGRSPRERHRSDEEPHSGQHQDPTRHDSVLEGEPGEHPFDPPAARQQPEMGRIGAGHDCESQRLDTQDRHRREGEQALHVEPDASHAPRAEGERSHTHEPEDQKGDAG